MDLTHLLDKGFVQVGHWRQNDDGKVSITAKIPHEPGIYLFVVDQQIKYVGVATRGLASRMRSYARRQNGSKSSRPIHDALAKAISTKETVAIYIRKIAKDTSTDWSGLPVNVLIGLEAALIEKFEPPWNSRR